MKAQRIYHEITDVYYLSICHLKEQNEYISECFVKAEGGIHGAYSKHDTNPYVAMILLDTKMYAPLSPRPYKAGQALDETIDAPVWHLFVQLCKHLELDAIACCKEAYKEHALTQDDLDQMLAFADWQGVETITNLSDEIIERVFTSLRFINLYSLVTVIETKLPNSISHKKIITNERTTDL
jgi:hypothetical protein